MKASALERTSAAKAGWLIIVLTIGWLVFLFLPGTKSPPGAAPVDPVTASALRRADLPDPLAQADAALPGDVGVADQQAGPEPPDQLLPGTDTARRRDDAATGRGRQQRPDCGVDQLCLVDHHGVDYYRADHHGVDQHCGPDQPERGQLSSTGRPARERSDPAVPRRLCHRCPPSLPSLPSRYRSSVHAA